MNPIKKDKYRYFAKNLLKGLAWLLLIIAIFLIVKNYFEEWYTIVMENVSDKPVLVFVTFTLSEIFFGIFPPELFMIWALHQGGAAMYATYSAILGLISFCAGLIGYAIGYQFSHSKLYQRFKKGKYGTDLEANVKKYGGFMVFIAAMTPIPFSAICMITGASRYHFYNFVLISTSRLLRFILYAYAIWGVDKI